MHKKGVYERYFKRLMDFSLSLIAFFVLLPLIFVVSLLVRIKLGSPILFKQARPGYKEKIFYLYKFRTMTDEKDDNGLFLSDEIRLTKFGRFLRATSLDELPGLINIIRGDMSIVGPRPLLVKYLPLYSNDQRKRHEVRPGLTGLAQTNGRNAISWDQKFEFDIKYVNEVSFLNDAKIIFKTIKKVLVKEGISSSTSKTMEEFKGRTN
jgi:lipopolysaccharide/colanic/teichoic acid biosynthesis glycosyltransferase